MADEVDEILEIVRSLPPLKDRVPLFRRPEGVSGGEASYDWLINEWMPKQEDFGTLVRLTVLLSFNMAAVVAALMGEARFTEFLKAKV